jgi:hypothetical protein
MNLVKQTIINSGNKYLRVPYTQKTNCIERKDGKK